APVAISIISRVMLDCLTLLYARVRSSMSSSAFSVAFFIATIRLESSLAFDSSTAWNSRVATYRGRTARSGIPRQELLEHGARVRLEDELVAGDARGVRGGRDRQQVVQDGPLDERRDEPAVDDVDRVVGPGEEVVGDQPRKWQDVAELG